MELSGLQESLCSKMDAVGFDGEFVRVKMDPQQKPKQLLAQGAVVGHDKAILFFESVNHGFNALPFNDYERKIHGLSMNYLWKYGIPFVDARSQFVQTVAPYRVLAGHSIDADLKSLEINKEPGILFKSVDVAECHHLVTEWNLRNPHNQRNPGQKLKLKDMAIFILDETIQSGNHCPIEDAYAVLRIFSWIQERYKCDCGTWSFISDSRRRAVSNPSEWLS